MEKEKTYHGLLTYYISRDQFKELLDSILYKEYVSPEDWQKYALGYSEKTGKSKSITVYTEVKGDLRMIIESSYLYTRFGWDFAGTCWKQVCLIASMDEKIEKGEAVKAEMTGTNAFNIVKKQLKRAYTDAELEAIHKIYENIPYEPHLAQYHYILSDPEQVYEYDKYVYCYDNCYYFDINGAHNKMLTQVYSKTTYFNWLFEKRHERPVNKKIANFYVGMLNRRKATRGLYNYIVQETTKTLFEGINKTDGKLIYANTDGYITKDPKYLLPHSRDLGKFKLEAHGQVYFYRDENYYIYQYVNGAGEIEKKGNLPIELREQINLFSGTVIHFKKRLNEYKFYEYYDITTEKLTIKQGD